MKRLSVASSRSIVRRNMSRDSASMSSRSSSRVLLPMFWIGCDRSCTRPAATRPNIACRSWRFTSSCSWTSRSAIVLNASPSSPNSSPVRMSTRVSSWPAATSLRARACSARIGLMKRAAEQVADRDHDEQRDRDGDDELPLRGRAAFAYASRRRLLDDDRPAERGNAARRRRVAAAVGRRRTRASRAARRAGRARRPRADARSCCAPARRAPSCRDRRARPARRSAR